MAKGTSQAESTSTVKKSSLYVALAIVDYASLKASGNYLVSQ